MSKKAAKRLLGARRRRGRPSAATAKRLRAARKLLKAGGLRKSKKKVGKRASALRRAAGRLLVNGRMVSPTAYRRWRRAAKRAGKSVPQWLRAKGRHVKTLGGRGRRRRKAKHARGVIARSGVKHLGHRKAAWRKSRRGRKSRRRARRSKR